MIYTNEAKRLKSDSAIESYLLSESAEEESSFEESYNASRVGWG